MRSHEPLCAASIAFNATAPATECPMGNAQVRDQLAALQVQVDAGEISIEEVGHAFKRLAWSLTGVSKGRRRLAASMVERDRTHPVHTEAEGSDAERGGGPPATHRCSTECPDCRFPPPSSALAIGFASMEELT